MRTCEDEEEEEKEDEEDEDGEDEEDEDEDEEEDEKENEEEANEEEGDEDGRTRRAPTLPWARNGGAGSGPAGTSARGAIPGSVGAISGPPWGNGETATVGRGGRHGQLVGRSE